MSDEELHGAEGRVQIDTVGHHGIDKRIGGGSPVRIEVTEDGRHRNLLARDAEIVLSVRDGEVTLNLSMDDVEEVSFDDWQAGNHSAVDE